MAQEIKKPRLLHDPKEYLNYYYNEITQEDISLYKFWCRVEKLLPKGSSMMEIGVGPGIYSAIPFIEKYEMLLLTDYLQDNLDEVDLSLKEHPEGFNWKFHIELALQLKEKPFTSEAVNAYFKNMQSKIQLEKYDMTVVSEQTVKQFDLVTAHFCIEAIGGSFSEWQNLVKNCLSRVTSGGYFLMSACTQLCIDRIYTPHKGMSTFSGLTQEHVENTLQMLGCKIILIEFIPAPEKAYYSGNILVLAKV